MIEYPEGVLGYQLFDLHPDLEPAIADSVRGGARPVSNLAPIVPNAADEPVSFASRDGWRLEGLLRLPAGSGLGPDQVGRGVVLVPGSHHERDTFVYGLALPDVLAEHGIASLRFDIRGRGASRSPRSWRELTTLERHAVADDVASTSDVLRRRALTSATATSPSWASRTRLAPLSPPSRAIPTSGRWCCSRRASVGRRRIVYGRERYRRAHW